MTLVLKSNVKMNAGNLKSKIALEPVVAADFVGETYLVNGQNVGINDVVTVRNNRYAGKLDAFGNYSEVSPVSVPVIGFDPNGLKKGLQIDAPSENFFVKGKTNPQSFTRQLTIAVGFVLVLKVIGEGSASLAIEGVVVGTATKGNPLVYKPATAGIANIAVTVAGNLRFGGLYRVADARLPYGRYDDVIRPTADTVSVNPSLLQLLTNMEGCLVFKNSYPEQVFDRSLTAVSSYLLAQLVDSASGSTAKGFSLAFRENSDINYLLRSYHTKEINITNNTVEVPPKNNLNNVAISFSKTKVTAVVNGKFIASSQLSAVDIDTIEIASGVWGVTTPQLIESYMLYNRQLTVDEMIAVTK